jgi:predicted 2-oxoglutarate/Fe(II)-dependent dioxygenase YbiX
MKDIRDYIVVVKEALPFELCDATLNEYANTNEWLDTHTKGGVLKDIRSAMTILMSTDQVIAINEQVRRDLDSKLFQYANISIRKYNERFEFAHIEQDSGYELLRYEQGQFYTEHVDSFKDMPRAVSCSFALNDDYGGGEFAFFGGQIKIKLPKGAALLFPSNFMYPHQILPVTNGTRYSIITWFI